jgi:hypothetical protein
MEISWIMHVQRYIHTFTFLKLGIYAKVLHIAS